MAAPTISTKSAVVLKAVLFCLINIAILKLSFYVQTLIFGSSQGLLSSLIGPILVVLVTYLFLKWDGKSFAAAGLTVQRSTFRKFVVGVVLGILVMGAYIVCIIYSLGLEIRGNNSASIPYLLVNALPTIILLAWMEEVVFRSYPLVILNQGAGRLAALLITSALFGLYHLVFGWGIAGFFSTAIWGLGFGLLALYSKGISMPTGFHAAGNFMQLALGTSGSAFSIWHITYSTGEPVRNFATGLSTTIISQLVLLTLVLIVAWVIFRITDRRSIA